MADAQIHPAAAQESPDCTGRKVKAFQREFDILLLGLLILGLFVALLYGSSAGICKQLAPQSVTSATQTAQPTAATQASRSAAPAQNRALTTVASPTSGARTPGQTARVSVSTVALQNLICVEERSGFASGFVGALLALLISLAALALGAVIGFLFGLPRSLTSSEFRAAQRQEAAKEDAEAGKPAEPARGSPGSEVNTNLEKISDWLTTIIVGVGLTKLQDIPVGVENFGDRVGLYFGYGGKVFGIADGLFFLIGGFFLAYVGTRVKLSLIFVWSQRTNRDAALEEEAAAVQTSGAAPPIAGQGELDEQLKRADEVLLSKSLADLKTPEEVLAWANAKARSGDFQSAVAGYRDALGRVPVTERLQTDYAQILAAAGDTAGANNIVASLATTTGITPDAENEVRQKVAAAAQVGRAASLRARLQQGLYKPRGFEDSIKAGEELLTLPDAAQDAWAHLWLAAAYGQKHASLRTGSAAADTAEQSKQRKRAVEEVRKALEIDPGVKPILQGLYDPQYRIGNDDDLDSLRPDPDLDALLLGLPSSDAS
jgi:tetratricopeptide (TPR) repeat protein